MGAHFPVQASVCYEGLDSVLAALAAHPQHTGIQTKGLVLLGVLLQGDEPLLVSQWEGGSGGTDAGES